MTTSPAFETSNKDGILVAGVTDSSYGFSSARINNKQLGSSRLSVNNLYRQPDVNFNFSYYLQVPFLNEKKMDFSVGGGGGSEEYFINGITGKDYNFLYMITPEQGDDAMVFYRDPDPLPNPDFTNYETVKIGNAFIQDYSVNFSVGDVPVVSVGFLASNIGYQTLASNIVDSPAINLTGGNSNNVGQIDLSTLIDRDDAGIDDRDTPQVIKPSEIELLMQDIQFGGQSLSGVHFVQSLDLNLALERASLYGLGNNYPYDRKLQFPARGTVSINSLVSGIDDGQSLFLDSMNTGEDKKYNFTVVFKNHRTAGTSGWFKITEAKLDSFNYSMSVNNLMNFSSEFSFEAGENFGLQCGYNLPT